MSDGDRLQLIRELRAMGAVRVRVGDLEVAFASATPQTGAQPAAQSSEERERVRREEDDDELLYLSAAPGGARI